MIAAARVVVGLLAAAATVAPTPPRPTVVPVVCEAVVVLGDSNVSPDPQLYASTIAALGFDRVVVWAGAGRALTFPDIRTNVLAVDWDGATGVFAQADHVAGLDTAILARWLAAGRQLCWVIALGANDAAHIPTAEWAPAIADMATLVGSDPVVWVNVWMDAVWPNYTPATATAWNSTLAATLDPTAVVYDWAAAVAADPSLLSADGGHATPAGHQARATAIAELLAQAVHP